MSRLAWLNGLRAEEAQAELLRCCGVRRWAEAMAQARPFASEEAVYNIRGWVRRERSTEDGRGNVAVLTDAGWDVVEKLAPGHVSAVRDFVFAPLTANRAARNVRRR